MTVEGRTCQLYIASIPVLLLCDVHMTGTALYYQKTLRDNYLSNVYVLSSETKHVLLKYNFLPTGPNITACIHDTLPEISKTFQINSSRRNHCIFTASDNIRIAPAG